MAVGAAALRRHHSALVPQRGRPGLRPRKARLPAPPVHRARRGLHRDPPHEVDRGLGARRLQGRIPPAIPVAREQKNPDHPGGIEGRHREPPVVGSIREARALGPATVGQAGHFGARRRAEGASAAEEGVVEMHQAFRLAVDLFYRGRARVPAGSWQGVQPRRADGGPSVGRELPGGLLLGMGGSCCRPQKLVPKSPGPAQGASMGFPRVRKKGRRAGGR